MTTKAMPATTAPAAPRPLPPYPGHEYDVSFLKHEFSFERLVDVRAS
ncbi:hypothetical protein [Streptomyces exfoliatus]